MQAALRCRRRENRFRAVFDPFSTVYLDGRQPEKLAVPGFSLIRSRETR
jgi:hypothetical protein